MLKAFKSVLILADIEGSSGCWSYRGSSFMTAEWAQACVEMSRDVDAVVGALFKSGVERVTVKDFHRTGYNLLPEKIDSNAKIIQGYQSNPIPGIGDPGDAEAALFLGMHAASGTDGFLAHTLTSRVEKLIVNDKNLAEIQLFAGSLAPFGIRPLFFSGCPVACRQAVHAINDIETYAIIKTNGREHFDDVGWRKGLAEAAVRALNRTSIEPFEPPGPFQASIRMKGGRGVARKLADRWGLSVTEGDWIGFESENIHELYLMLIKICYLTPSIYKFLPIGLPLFNLRGRFGQSWVRSKLK